MLEVGGIFRWLTELWDHQCTLKDVQLRDEERGRQFDRQECGAIVCSGAIRGIDYLHIHVGDVEQGEENERLSEMQVGGCAGLCSLVINRLPSCIVRYTDWLSKTAAKHYMQALCSSFNPPAPPSFALHLPIVPRLCLVPSGSRRPFPEGCYGKQALCPLSCPKLIEFHCQGKYHGVSQTLKSAASEND